MEAPDTRGAGGRAPRGRVASTPGKLAGLVASPLQIIKDAVKGLVGTSAANPGAAAGRPSPPSPSSRTLPAALRSAKVEDGVGSFSFPTLAGSTESPPTNSLSRPAAKPAALSPGAPARVAQDGLNGAWSPAKLASLNYFLNGAKLGAEVVRQSAASSSTELAGRLQPTAPYFNLTSMIRAGPGGLVNGTNGLQARAGVTGRPGAAASQTARYNPYGRPNVAKPPRPSTAVPPPQPSSAIGPAPSIRNDPVQSGLQAELQPSLAVATSRLPPPNPRAVPGPSGAVPRPPTAPGHVRLAPGQVAFASGRTGTPLPKFGPMVAAAGGQQQQQQQQQPTQTPAAFRPLAGAVGGRRQRDSPTASPLMSSGIRNLSEFKRRRQTSQQQPQSVLAGFAARTQRHPVSNDGERTPGAVGTGDSATTASVGGAVADVPATETARKILETLDNFRRAGDATASAGKSLLGSPFPGTFMPPLERLDQNHYGGTPTPSVTTGGPGFVCGATPSPSGIAGHAGPTPGPRMVLEFSTPVAFQAPLSRGQSDITPGAAVAIMEPATSTLPLSPIAVPQAAAPADRIVSTGAALATVSKTEAPAQVTAEAQNRTDAAAAVSAAAVRSSTAAHESHQRTGAVPAFRPPALPSDTPLRRAKDICSAHAAAAAGSSGGAEGFTFASPTVGADASTLVTKTNPVVLRHDERHNTMLEVSKAAETPLPDDDDEEEDETAAAPAPATEAASVSDGRVLVQAVKPVQPPAVKRVAYQPEEELAEKRKEADQPVKDGADAGRPSLISFGTATAAPADAGKSCSTLPFGQAAAPSSFAVGAPAKQMTLSSDNDVAGTEKAVADKPPGNTEGPSNLAAPLSAAAETAPAQPAPAPAFGQALFGAPQAAALLPSFPFGAPLSAPAFGASVASTAPANAPAAEPTSVPSPALPSIGTAAQLFGSSSTPSASSDPAPACGGSAPALSFGNTTASASAPAAAVGFAIGALASSASASESAAAPATSSAPAPPAPSFAFGAAQTLPGPSFPPTSFGSPMPVTHPSSAPMFGETHAKAGVSGFGAASGPATSFSFGAPANSGSSGGAANASSGGFDMQQGNSNPVATFSFGVTSSAPAFGANAVAPSFGAATAAAQQLPFGAAVSTFSAAANANPFGAAAPSFGAPTSQPAFGAAPASSGPSFGSTAAPAPATPPSFGGFGGSNGGAPAGGMFVFGGSAPTQLGAAQPAPAPTPAFGQAPPSFGMQTQPAQAPLPAYGAAPVGFGAPSSFVGAPMFGVAPPAPAGDAGGGFSLGLGDPKDGRKRVKARRHGH